MEIPSDINYILERIRKSEDEWKALYMGAWLGVYHLEGVYQKSELWEKKIDFGLPASKSKKYPYTPKELHSILSTRDMEFTLGQLQTIFSLLEELCYEASLALFNEERDMGKWKNAAVFLNKIGVSDAEVKELHLAKETRNCFIHNGSKIDGIWLAAYEKARGMPPDGLLGKNLNNGLPDIFPQIETWSEKAMNVAARIEQKIREKP